MRRPLGLIALLLVAASFLLPQAAAALLPAALRAEGFRGQALAATVDAWPPQEILLGRASRVTLTASSVTYPPVAAGSITVTLDDVDLFSRTTGSVHATLGDTTVNGAALGSVTVDGPNVNELTFRAVVPPATLEREVANAVGGSVTIQALQPPDTVAVRIGPLLARPKVSVAPDGRSLELAAGGLPIRVSVLVVEADAPVRLRQASVVPGGLLVQGTVDVGGINLRRD